MPIKISTGGGRRSQLLVTADHPDCPDQRWECAWGVLNDGRWWLKFINNGCLKHTHNPAVRA